MSLGNDGNGALAPVFVDEESMFHDLDASIQRGKELSEMLRSLINPSDLLGGMMLPGVEYSPSRHTIGEHVDVAMQNAFMLREEMQRLLNLHQAAIDGASVPIEETLPPTLERQKLLLAQRQAATPRPPPTVTEQNLNRPSRANVSKELNKKVDQLNYVMRHCLKLIQILEQTDQPNFPVLKQSIILEILYFNSQGERFGSVSDFEEGTGPGREQALDPNAQFDVVYKEPSATEEEQTQQEVVPSSGEAEPPTPTQAKDGAVPIEGVESGGDAEGSGGEPVGQDGEANVPANAEITPEPTEVAPQALATTVTDKERCLDALAEGADATVCESILPFDGEKSAYQKLCGVRESQASKLVAGQMPTEGQIEEGETGSGTVKDECDEGAQDGQIPESSGDGGEVVEEASKSDSTHEPEVLDELTEQEVADVGAESAPEKLQETEAAQAIEEVTGDAEILGEEPQSDSGVEGESGDVAGENEPSPPEGTGDSDESDQLEKVNDAGEVEPSNENEQIESSEEYDATERVEITTPTEVTAEALANDEGEAVVVEDSALENVKEEAVPIEDAVPAEDATLAKVEEALPIEDAALVEVENETLPAEDATLAKVVEDAAPVDVEEVALPGEDATLVEVENETLPAEDATLAKVVEEALPVEDAAPVDVEEVALPGEDAALVEVENETLPAEDAAPAKVGEGTVPIEDAALERVVGVALEPSPSDPEKQGVEVVGGGSVPQGNVIEAAGQIEQSISLVPDGQVSETSRDAKAQGTSGGIISDQINTFGGLLTGQISVMDAPVQSTIIGTALVVGAICGYSAVSSSSGAETESSAVEALANLICDTPAYDPCACFLRSFK